MTEQQKIQLAKSIWRKHAMLREGLRLTVYRDTRDLPTVGIGHLVRPQDNLRVGQKISRERVEELFEQDSSAALRTSIRHWHDINHLTPEFLAALVSVNFQLGDFSQKFKNSYALLKERKIDMVINNLRGSLWFRQTPVRVEDFIKAIKEIPS
jgi:GH24 family phage-related lysozyme (muramidase)